MNGQFRIFQTDIEGLKSLKRFFNVKELVSTFNKEKDLVVGAFSGYYEKFFKVHQQLYLYQGDSFLGDFWGIWDNNYDDSGFNAIRLLCSGGEVLKSAEGVEGDWTPWTFTRGQKTPIRAVSIRSQRPCDSCDDTATHGLRFEDTDGNTYESWHRYWYGWHVSLKHRFDGYWAYAECTSSRQVVTGFRTQVEPDQGGGDDSGLNRVAFICTIMPS